jgi:hypothetical protein
MKRVISGLTAVLGVAVLTAACAKEPADALNAAKTALDAARAADAADYAPASLGEAETAATALQAELKAQSETFALMRSYTKAGELAADAKAKAEKAAVDAAAGKEAAKQEATALIGNVKVAVDEVTQLLTKAPKGKGTQADIEAMKADLAAIGASVADMDTALAGGSYKDAKAKAEAAMQGLDKIKADIEAAMAAKKAGGKR